MSQGCGDLFATAVRDTRNREPGHLEFTATEWTVLLGTLTTR
ncbi:DUF397 domain-containing protein [Nocardiopsis sp. N85]|nr:DUF397 domain-containing protein [Nocardiopsis sp. N85]MDE3721570.1 DUF397 domain-containing protein [Nocardiopsis sp. N85]